MYYSLLTFLLLSSFTHFLVVQLTSLELLCIFYFNSFHMLASTREIGCHWNHSGKLIKHHKHISATFISNIYEYILYILQL